jgi:quercetin dioxygenase-like cupin family protein
MLQYGIMSQSPPLPAVPTVKIDNAQVRVTEWRFAPGAATGRHRHEYPYVVVPLTTGPLAMAEADGTRVASLARGEPYFRPAGVQHDVRNPNPSEFVFIEIELKSPSP